MGLLGRLFRRARAPRLDHPLFGALVWQRVDGWTNPAFAFWGFDGVELLIDADAAGPTEAQCAAFRRFETRATELWPRVLAEVERVRAELGSAAGHFRASGLTIPSLCAERAGSLWTLWLDLSILLRTMPNVMMARGR